VNAWALWPTGAKSQRRSCGRSRSQQIDEEVRRIIELQNRAREILLQNRDCMDRVARALMERETLDRQQLDRLFRRAT
jgi:cell division protease FtsH